MHSPRPSARVARPQVKTVAAMGDGSFGMCVGELETAVRLAPDHFPRDLERGLRLDQGRAEGGLRAALLFRRFRRHGSREGG